MMKRLTFLATLAVATAFATDAWAQAAAVGFSGYTQTSSPSSVSYTRLGGPFPVQLTINAEEAFSVTDPSFLKVPGPTLFTGATLSLTAQSSSMVSGAALATEQDGFTGTFSIIASDGTTNLLSGTFSSALLSQNRSGLAVFETNTVEFTSDIFKDTFDEDFILTLSGGFSTLTTSGGAYDNFTANTSSGNFNALVIPEPATVAMAGLGVLALPLTLRVVRRRKAGIPR